MTTLRPNSAFAGRVLDGTGDMAMMEKANDVNALLRRHVDANAAS